jgi:hypothetical protein
MRADVGVGPYRRLGGYVGDGSHPVPVSNPEVVCMIATRAGAEARPYKPCQTYRVG